MSHFLITLLPWSPGRGVGNLVIYVTAACTFDDTFTLFDYNIVHRLPSLEIGWAQCAKLIIPTTPGMSCYFENWRCGFDVCMTLRKLTKRKHTFSSVKITFLVSHSWSCHNIPIWRTGRYQLLEMEERSELGDKITFRSVFEWLSASSDPRHTCYLFSVKKPFGQFSLSTLTPLDRSRYLNSSVFPFLWLS